MDGSNSKIGNNDELNENNEAKVSEEEKQSDENITSKAEENLEEEQVEHLDDEELDDEEQKQKDKTLHEEHGEEISIEEIEEEKNVEEQLDEQEKTDEQKPPETTEEVDEEEEGYVEEPPPDPAAPLDFSESKEMLKPQFDLRPDQIAEVEQLWELYQNYTPAYTDLDGYITEKELVYMLKSLLLMTYTPEQLQELIAFCVKPSHPQGHINYDQFLKMVTLRQRDFPIEDELRSSLQVLDPGRTGSIDREYLKELLAKQGHKMPQKQLDNLIKEVDISNDGTIGIEDVVGTMCIDLNKDDLIMLMASLNPPEENADREEA
ncbi:chemotaxis regulatory protein ChePep-like [Vanessa atalanta]|uniref:chemotaxis regulatory protein ChePep-like n=1 Tax=Vanessa atalanta TaxID=42275 RepID=UPI001FCDD285|nr:chemotaxis regulatory protein ChePep-like [Vanessa atalanta]